MENHFHLISMPRWMSVSFRIIYVMHSLISDIVGQRMIAFDNKLKLYSVPKLRMLYCCAFNIGLITLMPISICRIYDALLKNEQTNDILMTVMIGVMLLQTCLCIIMFLMQIKGLKDRLRILNESAVFIRWTRDYLYNHEIELKQILWLIFLRVVVCEVYAGLMIIMNVLSVIEDTLNLSIEFLIISLPYIMQTVVLTDFYAVILRIFFYFRQLNRNIEILAEKLKDSRDMTEYQWMTYCCELSDRIDKFSIYHAILCESTKAIVRIYSINILCCLVTLFCGIVFQTYFTVEFFKLYLQGIVPEASESFSTILFIFSNFFELLIQGYLTTMLDYEAKRIGRLIHKISITNTDLRLQRSVQLFSLQTAQYSAEISICGLFNLDIPFISSMTASIVSYMIIIVQFDETSYP
uniref:Gustatory receptor n=1 Tax=Lutzomyia longipalpis TaxID=7200 RepID=A0A3F2ZDB2_LUTLO